VTFRLRILLISMVLWLPLFVLAAVTRKEMSQRVTEEHERRVATQVALAERDLAARKEDIKSRLDALGDEIADDNRFRLVAGDSLYADRSYVLDYAGRAMNLLGFAVLRIQDAQGKIVSSGHFRNEYDRLAPVLPRIFARHADKAVLIKVRRPEGFLLSLAAMDSVQLGEQPFTVLGGIEVNREFLQRLARDSDLTVSLVYPGGALSSDPGTESRLRAAAAPESTWTAIFPPQHYEVRPVDLPYVADDPGSRDLQRAEILASYSLAPLHRLLRSLDLWLAAVLLATLAGALLLSLWASMRISRPLVELSRKTAEIDLDRLHGDLASDRRDEVGELSRFLSSMVARLRTSALRLREAERRATLGELARQVNHDMRNGLTPIRNTFRHLSQVADEGPERLWEVWRERSEALRSSITYLEGLAENYARLYRQNPRQDCDLDAIVREVTAGHGAPPGVDIALDLEDDLPSIVADPLALRRVVENLVANAFECFRGGTGTVSLTTRRERGDDGAGTVRLEIADDGPGIPKDEIPRIWGDFYTTKERGTGLGLSIVRRLVTDCDGSIEVHSESGAGTRFVVRFPAAGSPRPTPARVGEPIRS
jgi:signal transduction histidine kinase